MRRRRVLAAVGTAGATSIAGCLGGLGTGGDRCGENCDVGMSANAFLPRELEVPVGTTVVWKNTSSRAHTVTAYEAAIPGKAEYFASGGYDSEEAAREAWNSLQGGIATGETYEHTFELPGRYDYFCVPHEPQGMVGKVLVTE
jgi:plastocyanin